MESALAQPRELFWELGKHSELERGRWTALRQGKYKLLTDDMGREYLFDLSRDPAERHNMLLDPDSESRAIRRRLSARATFKRAEFKAYAER